jgi:hypothetical protein
MTSYHGGVQTSPPAAPRSQLLADLLHQTDEILADATVPDMTFVAASKKRHASPSYVMTTDLNFSKESPTTKTDYLLTAKRPKWSADNVPEAEQLAVSASTKNRIQVRSTWRVPSTNIYRRHVTGSTDELSSQFNMNSPSPAERHDSVTAASGRSPPVPPGARVTSPQTVVEASQVWTAVDKALVLDVIDHLLDLEVGDKMDAGESAIDLTIVRPHATVVSTGTSLTSGRELLALLSYTSTANSFHSDAKSSFLTQRDGCGWQSIAGEQTDMGNDGDGSADMAEVSSQLKWKSNIMQRMRREQTTTGNSAVIMAQSGCGIWRRGGNSITATGS